MEFNDVVFDNSSNVGIGNAAPKARMHIGTLTGGNATAQEQLRLSGDWTSTNSGALLRFTNQHNSGTNPNAGEYNLAGIKAFDFRSDWGGAIALQTAPNTAYGGTLVDRLVINPEGLVGIGAPAPTEKLEVDGGIKISNSNSRLYFGTEGGTSYRALEGSTNGSLLQVGENYTDIALQGNIAINTTTTYDTALRVVGATSTVNGHGDLASISTETGSVVSSGSIKHEIGYSGTYSSGKTFTWTYAATSWKSFHVSLKVASTAGFSSYEGGGYNNNGGPMNTVEHGNDLGSLVITRSGQQMIMTYTTNTTHIHPFFELTYRQSGGDGSPRMDRLSLVQT